MSNYPANRPATLDDVRRGHMVGKVTDVTQHNSIWLRDALDIVLAELKMKEAALEDKDE
jgi:hypothetical protein